MFQLAAPNEELRQKVQQYCQGCPHLQQGLCTQLNRLLDSFLAPQQPMPCFQPLHQLDGATKRPARQRARRSPTR